MMKLRKTRKGTPAREKLGDYYIVDETSGQVVRDHIDMEKLGRELGCLKPWEVLVPDKKEPH
jgi:hypothetical protein